MLSDHPIKNKRHVNAERDIQSYHKHKQLQPVARNFVSLHNPGRSQSSVENANG